MLLHIIAYTNIILSYVLAQSLLPSSITYSAYNSDNHIREYLDKMFRVNLLTFPLTDMLNTEQSEIYNTASPQKLTEWPKWPKNFAT